jgi:hypothetical protein
MELVYTTEDRGSLVGFTSTPLPVLFRIKVLLEPLQPRKIDNAGLASDHVEGRLARSDGSLIVGLQSGQRLVLRSNRGTDLDIETTDTEGGFMLLSAVPKA